jgi:hypothetical protein
MLCAGEFCSFPLVGVCVEATPEPQCLVRRARHHRAAVRGQGQLQHPRRVACNSQQGRNARILLSLGYAVLGVNLG